MKRIISVVLCFLCVGAMEGQRGAAGAMATSAPATTTQDAGAGQTTGQDGGAANGAAVPTVVSPEAVVIRDAKDTSDASPHADEDSQQATGQNGASKTETTKATGRSATVAATAPLSDFQRFVATAVGHSLPVFGASLFQGTTDFAGSGNVPVPADYVIGPGDQILVRAWGKIDMDTHLTVDRAGQVFLPRVGTLTVAGLRMDQLDGFFRSAIGQQFTGFELTVSLGTLRSIQIFVLGQVNKPGVYTISSLSTLVNALFTSGGPSATGTMRDIQVKRDGKVITHFDVYRLLLQGDKSADVHLLPGDIIFIPEIGPQVALDGNVKTPAIYELKGQETVGSLVTEAGGLTVVAGTGRAVLERIVEHTTRSIEEFALNADGLQRPLRDGDVLRVFPISPKIENVVTLRGTVGSPGLYAWHPGMRISDLIPSREFLLTSAYYTAQNQQGQNGAPSNIGGHDTEVNWNYAVIQRLNPGDLTTKLVPFVLGEAVDHPESAENRALEPGDVVVVYSRADVTLPLQLQAKFVRIEGEVFAPGTYRVSDGETLPQLIQQAGGLTTHAYLYASRLTRESVQRDQAEQLRRLVDQESKEALQPSGFAASLSGNAANVQTTQVQMRQEYIARLSATRPDGRVVLRLRPDAATIADLPPFVLEDGDTFTVPPTTETVTVLGNVYNEGTMRFQAGQHVERYLNAAGGPTRSADKKREFVIHADGSITSRQQISNLEHTPVYAGDTLVVPPNLKGPSTFDFLGAATVIGSLALGAAAIKELQ